MSEKKVVRYKGCNYSQVWKGKTPYGEKAKLAFLDGTKEFWVLSSKLETPVKQEQLTTKANDAAATTRLALEGGGLQKCQAARQRAEEEAEIARKRLTESTSLSGQEIKRLKVENERLQKKSDEARNRRESSEDGEGKKLLELWAIHFPKMRFQRQPVGWTVRKNHSERVSLERKLVELHSSDNPVSLSLSKIRTTGEDHLKFHLGKVECRMYYRVENQQIIITRLGTNGQAHR